MKRTIKAYGSYYKDFFNTLDKQTQEKILYGMLLLKTQGRLPSKFVKYIRDGLYELRGNIVILFNGFQKKTQKTPEKEIEKGLKIKAEYEEKRNRNV